MNWMMSIIIYLGFKAENFFNFNQRHGSLIENRRKDEIRNYIGHTWK